MVFISNLLSASMRRSRLLFSAMTLTIVAASSVSTNATTTNALQCFYVEPTLVDHIRENPTFYLSQVKIAPTIRSNQYLGFQLSHVRSDSTAAQMGLKKNDMIIAINGVYLPDILAFNEAMRQIPEHPDFSLHIMRQQKELVLRYVLAPDAFCSGGAS